MEQYLEILNAEITVVQVMFPSHMLLEAIKVTKHLITVTFSTPVGQ